MENFKVLEGQHYPHIELLRYVAELGVLGLAIVTFVYIYPIRRLAKDPIGKFSFFYMLGFMVTTLFQPSGPLTHLNNSFLYWMLFGHIILVEKENFKFMRGGAGGLLRLEQLASKVICLRNTDMNVRFYTLFSTLIFFSGLSIAWLNVPFLNGTVSLIRVGWAGLLIYIVLKITWNREILRHPLVLLFLFWILLHIFNFLILDGAATAILTRIFQASFITALLIIIMQRGFDLATFCKAINPLFSLVAGIALLAFLFASVISSGLFYMIQGSIIGVSSNFSIFCSQLFALFLLKDLHKIEPKKGSLFVSMVMLVLLTLPILGWQVVSSGRTGLLLTIIAACGYGFAKERFKGAVIAFLVLSATIVILDEAFKLFPYIFELTKDLIQKGVGLARQGDGIFRKFDKIISLISAHNDGQELREAVNTLSSWRIDGLQQTLQALKSDKLLFGFGVNNFQITTLTGTHYPHVELLRYCGELGLLGAAVAIIIYAYPFVQPSSTVISLSKKVKIFSLVYMIGFA